MRLSSTARALSWNRSAIPSYTDRWMASTRTTLRLETVCKGSQPGTNRQWIESAERWMGSTGITLWLEMVCRRWGRSAQPLFT